MNIPIMVNTGLLSGGKTINSLMWAIDVLNKPIITNMKLDYPSEYISDKDIIDFMKDTIKKPRDQQQRILEEKFGNKTLLIDEAEFIFNARLFAKNYYQLALIRQLGKIGCNLQANCHVFESDMDKIIRHLVNAITYCKRVTASGNRLLFADRKLKEKIYIEVSMWIKDGQDFMQRSYKFDPEEYYKYYKTEEVIMLDRT